MSIEGNHVFLRARLMDAAVDDDDVEPVMFLQNPNFFQWLSIHHYTVGVVALFDLTHLVRTHKQLCHTIGGCYNGLM